VTKAAPDQVVSIRLEMQSFEREQLETLVTARAVGDVLKGVGAVLTPFTDVISVVFAALIAKHGWDYLSENAGTWKDEFFEKEKGRMQDAYANSRDDPRYADMSFEEYEDSQKVELFWYVDPILGWFRAKRG